MKIITLYKDLSFALLIFSVLSCKSEFNQAEVDLFDMYNKGDTLVFHSSAGDTSIFTITEKLFMKGGWNEGSGQNYGRCVIDYERVYPLHAADTLLPPNLRETILCFANKSSPEGKINIDFHFEGFGGVLNIYDSNMTPAEITRIIELTHFCLHCKGVEDHEAVKIFWQMERGVIRYITKDGREWNLLIN